MYMYNYDEIYYFNKCLLKTLPFITSTKIVICWYKLVLGEMFETSVPVKTLTKSSPTAKVKIKFYNKKKVIQSNYVVYI